MAAIYKRELGSYFHNVIAWIFTAALFAVFGLYFYLYNLRMGYPYISYTISSMVFILIIAVPFLAMRSFSEERHLKTEQLILTSPVRLVDIVLGKYLALVTVFSFSVLLMAIAPLYLAYFGDIPLREAYVAILGFWLLGDACLAVCMFISSLTESQIIAAIGGFAAMFIAYVMDGICGLISADKNILTRILSAYDFYTPIQNFMNGCLSLKGIVYYLSVAAVAIALTCQLIQKRRYIRGEGKIVKGAYSAGMIVLVLAIAVGVNIAVGYIPENYSQIDLTANKIFRLTEDTENYIRALDEDIDIYVLSDEASADATLSETLKRYEDLNQRINVEYKNPATNPAFYQNYTDSQPAVNSMIVSGERRSKLISYDDIYTYEYDYQTYEQKIKGYDAEGQITSAIRYVTLDSESLPKIYELTGHGEQKLKGGFSDAIAKANMTDEELNIIKEDAVPDDAGLVIINGPASDFSKADADKIIAYLDRGGRLIMTFDYEAGTLKNYESVAESFGVRVEEGVVAENDMEYFYAGNPFYLLPEVSTGMYTSSSDGYYIFSPFARGFSYDEDEDTTSYDSFLMTSASAVSKTDVMNAGTSEMEDGDIMGPFSVGMSASRTGDETDGKLILLGSSEMLTDDADEVVSGANESMFSRMLAKEVDDGDASVSAIAIPVKEYNVSTVTITSYATLFSGLAAAIFVPIVLIISGTVIFALRRKK